MKTTLVIDDLVMTRLREKAAREDATISSLVETALRLLLDRPDPPRKLPPLPSYHGGKLLVDVADREALDALFDQDRMHLYRGQTAKEPATPYRAGKTRPARKRRS